MFWCITQTYKKNREIPCRQQFFAIFVASVRYPMKDIAIIGAGAAGCFCAAELSRMRPDFKITVLEAQGRPMAKLAVTGGGRCNITNSFRDVRDLRSVYPRGYNLMKRLLPNFGPADICSWFEREGVRFVVQDDQCIFPESQDAMQIVKVLERRMHSGAVSLKCGSKVSAVHPDLRVEWNGGCLMKADTVVVCSGGAAAGILEPCSLEVEPYLPSLFTLKLSESGLKELMGTVVDNVVLGLAGTKHRSTGTLLLTDWGISGPATLKLSSYAARDLAAKGYKGQLLVNWLGICEAECKEILGNLSEWNGRMVSKSHPQELTDRLWRYLVGRAQIRENCRWGELGSKGMARLVNTLISDSYEICGRARFKEEFVTCGGVSLKEIDKATMESRKVPGLYLAGEVLDIDAVTGGFNLQAAWSTAWTAAHAIANKL